MIKKSTVSILLLSVVAFLGGVVGSISARSGEDRVAPTTQPGPCHPLAQCLTLDPERRARIEALDPTFFDDLAALREKLADDRRELAGLLESPESTNDDIRACVERSIETHNRLERRVLEHLLLVRPELTLAEQKRLFQSISERIREHGPRFGRHRGPDSERPGPGAGPPHPRGRGHRRGDLNGPRWRGAPGDESEDQGPSGGISDRG
jgi:hypothetical protein